MDRTPIDWLIRALLEALAREEGVPPAGLVLLIREYATSGRTDVADALAQALARALAASESSAESGRRADWVQVFVEAAACSEDERLLATAATLAAQLVGEWPSRGRVATAMPSINACLAVVQVAASTEEAGDVLGKTIDELERVVGIAYSPGEGLAGSVEAQAGRGGLSDHVEAAHALLSAFDATARLPYSMLAEELMQFARRCWWNADLGCFTETGTLNPEPPEPNPERGTLNLELFLSNCSAVRVFCRMAALHHDADYREAAVIASDSNYARDGETILTSLGAIYQTYGLEAAVYGLALGEYLGLRT